MPLDVFISYRGADRMLARKLEQRLRSRWGSRVFRDETSLMPGRSWSEQLEKAMCEAKVMLALIGPGWRLRDEGEDWVKNELLGAIEAGNPVLPVLIGDPDKLNDRLGQLPQAFDKQAVKVRSDLAGFDLHQIEKALRKLGAFGERQSGGLGSELSETIPNRCGEIIQQLLDGQSLIIAGASGSGRGALLNRIAEAVRKNNELVTTCGIELGPRSRRTHTVIAAWIDGLCQLILEKPPEEQKVFGPALVKAILEFGPDLLAHQVLRPGLLMPLGDDKSDQKILDAAQKTNDRWAPFPPERLVSQSVSVLENFAAACQSLTLVVDNVESIDGSSKNLLKQLLRRPFAQVRLVIATSALRENAMAAPAKDIVARELDIDLNDDVNLLADFESISLHDSTIWGEPGDIVKSWLTKHKIQLDAGVSDIFMDTNPYYALSSLWYLVDNGYLVQKKVVQSSVGEKASQSSQKNEIATWVASSADQALSIPSRDRLLDHMIEEFVPVEFRKIIAVGALMGRRFIFSAAYAATHPVESFNGQQSVQGAIELWQENAEHCWQQLSEADPDKAVIVCHLSADNERMINLSQLDLVTHLANQLTNAEKLHYHKLLAQYFCEPIADDSSETLDDKYRNARAAAFHWASAHSRRDAADAERVAAGLAEKSLAYPEARGHYRKAIRLFTQLLAENEPGSTLTLVDHEDHLILASCLYRLGQITRLANTRQSSLRRSSDPEYYFKQALKRLSKLSDNLHNKQLVAPSSEKHAAKSHRDLPEPNLIRHHIRLCETLSGWVTLEQAECCSASDPKNSLALLFDALRHAESARGEADSRWLLAAASAQLAKKLLNDANMALQTGHEKRAHNLAIEAQFHIERVINLAAVSPDEDQNLEEPRSFAWSVLGELFQSIRLDSQLSRWAFMRMNDHQHKVSDLVDKMTDRQLGLFHLSVHSGEHNPQTEETRKLLKRHRDWAIETGIVDEISCAYLGLALLDIVEQSKQHSLNLQIARAHACEAVRYAINAEQKQDALLVQGLVVAIEHGQSEPSADVELDEMCIVSHDHPDVLALFTRASDEITDSHETGSDVLHAGWKALLFRLLRWCPHLVRWMGAQCYLSEPELSDEKRWAQYDFFSELVNAQDGELKRALERAKIYLKSADHDQRKPGSDESIWKLLQSRVATECYQHAIQTKKNASELLEQHSDLLGGEDNLAIHNQNLSYAIAVHEWYRSTDPSRLLSLARESNLEIDGHEWASPKLLAGRLAIHILSHQYSVEKEIGRQRLRQIKSMVRNWATGSSDAGFLEQIFYVAVQQQEPIPTAGALNRRLLSEKSLPLEKAYQLALNERAKLVHQAGLRLVQDLYLLDADAGAQQVEVKNSVSDVSESDVEHLSSNKPAVETPDRRHHHEIIP